MAGLQEQVRQLEEVNEDMLEETTRYGDNRFRESTRMWADPRLGLLRCCLMFPRLGHRERRARRRSLSTFVLLFAVIAETRIPMPRGWSHWLEYVS